MPFLNYMSEGKLNCHNSKTFTLSCSISSHLLADIKDKVLTNVPVLFRKFRGFRDSLNKRRLVWELH